MSTQALAGGTDRKEGNAMSRSGIGLGGGRLAAVALAMGLVVILAGDGGRAATVPAVVNGQDPLEVLALKVRPNVIIVLDSSGSMKWTLDPAHGTTGSPVNSGDHPRSKIYQAKQVLKTIVAETCDALAMGLGNAINLYHPHRVVVGGASWAVSDLFMGALCEQVERYVFEPFAAAYEVVPGELGEGAVVVGAGLLAWRAAGVES